MQVYGLVGSPVRHSLSPPMHEAVYDALGMNARYVTFEPTTIDAAIRGADALGIEGLNVTAPFKESVLEHVSTTPAAQHVGAVNTIDFTGNQPTGYNTDLDGVRGALARHDVVIPGRRAVVVGAGGFGRAAAFSLALNGAAVAIANRTVERARNVAAAIRNAPSTLFESSRPTAGIETAGGNASNGRERHREEIDDPTGHSLDAVGALLGDADLLINATPVGMHEDAAPVPLDALHEDLVVMDAVYRPRHTTLLRAAARTGALAIDGTWPLVYQGAASVARWTGERPRIEIMHAAVLDALADEEISDEHETEDG